MSAITKNPNHIIESFHPFFSKLYSNDNYADYNCLDAFLEEILLPGLKDSHHFLLDSPISEA